MHWERSTVAVTLLSPPESEFPLLSGTHVREKIEKIIHDTLQINNQPHLRFSHRLHCNFHLSPYDTPVDIYSVAHAEGGMTCKGDECHGRHRLTPSDLSFWGIKETSRQSYRFRPRDVESHLDRRPTPKELGRISYRVSPSYCQELFIELGLSMPDISHMQQEAKGLASVTQITKMFLKWTYSYPNQTFRHIKHALCEADQSMDSLLSAAETGLEDENLGEMESNRGLNKQLVDSEIRGLVKNIGKDYFNLFLELGLSVPAIEKCEMNPDDVEQMFEKLFKSWIKAFRDQATIIKVIKAMKFCKMNWQPTAQAYCHAVDTETLE